MPIETMKKIIIIWILLLCGGTTTIACDICGCGSGSFYLGILPDFNSKIAGVRYRYNNIRSHIGPGGSTSYLTTDERYHTAEVWGGWTFQDRVRVMANMPFHLIEKSNQEGLQRKSGPGDLMVQSLYRLLRHKGNLFKDNALVVQDLWLGGGIKLPTGKYMPSDKDESGKSANLFQLGTGSFDFMLLLMYDIRIQDIGLNLNSNYKLNTANRYDYNYGNKWSNSVQVYYKLRLHKHLLVTPNAGIQYEYAARDLDEGYPALNSGGQILFGSFGAETSYRKLALGGNWQPVWSQNLAAGAIKARNRFMLHLSFLL